MSKEVFPATIDVWFDRKSKKEEALDQCVLKYEENAYLLAQIFSDSKQEKALSESDSEINEELDIEMI